MDSTGNHLKLYEDSEDKGWCFKCKETISVAPLSGDADYRGNKKQRGNVANNIDMARIATLPFRDYPERKISKETMEFFGVRTGVNVENGQASEHYYPYFDEYGKVTGYKCRVLPKTLYAVEGSKIKSMFGKGTCQGGKFLIIVEGEHDALAAHEMLKHLKPDRRPYNVVSIPLGANDEGTLDQVLRKEMEWIAGFEKVVLILDMDTPGRATSQTIADYLVSSVDVRIASLPLKDTADMWEAGRSQDWLDAISNAKKYVSDQVVCGTDTPLKDLLKPIPQGTMYPFLPKTCAKLDGFRPKEMTTLIAPPNVGKSSLFRQMLHHTLLTTDKPVGAFFLEEGIDKTKQSVLAYHAGIPLNKFRKMSQREKENNPLVVEAYETLLPRLHLFEHKRKTLTDDFIERKIEYMVKALGCTDVLFDHLSYVVGGRDSANERKDIDMLMTRLSRSVEDWNYHLFLVSHIKRGGKEKSRREDSQKYPFWEVLDMSDGRGSGSIEQLSHNMVAMEKQILDPALDNTRGLVRTRILRSREWGLTGIADYLTWNEFGQFTPIEGDF